MIYLASIFSHLSQASEYRIIADDVRNLHWKLNLIVIMISWSTYVVLLVHQAYLC